VPLHLGSVLLNCLSLWHFCTNILYAPQVPHFVLHIQLLLIITTITIFGGDNKILILLYKLLGAFAYSQKYQLASSFPCVGVCYVHPRVRLPVRMCKSGSHLTDFREIWYWGLLWKYVEKSGKNIGCFAWRHKYVCMLPATLNHHRSDLVDWNRVKLLG